MTKMDLVGSLLAAIVAIESPVLAETPTSSFEQLASTTCKAARLPSGRVMDGLDFFYGYENIHCSSELPVIMASDKVKDAIEDCERRLKNFRQQLWSISLTTRESGNQYLGPSLTRGPDGKAALLSRLQGRYWPLTIKGTAYNWWGLSRPTGYTPVKLDYGGQVRPFSFPVLTTKAPPVPLPFTELRDSDAQFLGNDLRVNLIVKYVGQMKGTIPWRSVRFGQAILEYDGVQFSLVAWQVFATSPKLPDRLLGSSHPHDEAKSGTHQLCDGTQAVPGPVPPAVNMEQAKAQLASKTARLFEESRKRAQQEDNSSAKPPVVVKRNSWPQTDLPPDTEDCYDHPTGKVCLRSMPSACPVGTVALAFKLGCYCNNDEQNVQDEHGQPLMAPFPKCDKGWEPVQPEGTNGTDGRFCFYECTKTFKK